MKNVSHESFKGFKVQLYLITKIIIRAGQKVVVKQSCVLSKETPGMLLDVSFTPDILKKMFTYVQLFSRYLIFKMIF